MSVPHERLRETNVPIHEKEFESVQLSVTGAGGDTRLAHAVSQALGSVPQHSPSIVAGVHEPRPIVDAGGRTRPGDERVETCCGMKKPSKAILITLAICFIVLFLVFIIISVRSNREMPPGVAPAPPTEEWENIRLSGVVRPLHYAINTTIDLDSFRFNGSVAIQMYFSTVSDDPRVGTEYIVIHAVDLDISNSYLQAGNRTYQYFHTGEQALAFSY